jgi:hypothetical protein
MQSTKTDVVLYNSIFVSDLVLHDYLFACNQTVRCVQVCDELHERFIYVMKHNYSYTVHVFPTDMQNIFSVGTKKTGHVVAQLVEALCYKAEWRGFHSRWGHCFFFYWPNPSGRTVALGSTQPLTEMSTRNLPGGVKDGRSVSLTTLPPSVSRLFRKNVGASTSQKRMGFHGLLRG